MVNIFGKPLHPTEIKLLENKAIYNLVLNHMVVFTIIERGDLRKKNIRTSIQSWRVHGGTSARGLTRERKGRGLPGGEQPEQKHQASLNLTHQMTPKRRLDLAGREKERGD